MCDNFLKKFCTYKGNFSNATPLDSLNAWIDNFKYFNFYNLNILYKLLDTITFVYDFEIIDSFDDFVNRLCMDKFTNLYICNFGISNESSYRIIHSNISIKFKVFYDIHELISNINLNEKNIVFFVDDFLVSGGQFASIIQSFFSNNSNRRELNLSKNEIKIFSKIKKFFFFYKGTETGLKKANSTLEKYNINKSSAVKIANKFDIENTIFGRIINGKPNFKESIFYNCASLAEIEKFFEIIKIVGIQILEKNKTHWTRERIEDSFLGYGNNGQLIFGEYNVPTCTITSLWSSANIEYNGNKFKWYPLVFRKEKKLEQTEHIL